MVPKRGIRKARLPRPTRAQVPRALRRARRRLPARRDPDRGARPHRLGRHGGGDRRARQHRNPADLEVRHRGAEAALPRPRDRGEKIGALAITEPGAGSDVAALRSLATRVDGGWSLNGEKTYITNGVRADFLVTAVKTTEQGGHHGISFLIVDRGEGVISSPLEKLGWHASDTATIAFEDVFVPEENLLGGEHEGFKLIMANFQWERLAMAWGPSARCGSPGSAQPVRARTLDLWTSAQRPSSHPPQTRGPRDLGLYLPLRHL